MVPGIVEPSRIGAPRPYPRRRRPCQCRKSFWVLLVAALRATHFCRRGEVGVVVNFHRLKDLRVRD